MREVVALAKELGVSAAQVALAWLRHRPVPAIPIVGARKLSQLEDNVDSLNLTLTAEQLTRLDAVSAKPKGFPHDFLESAAMRTVVHSGLYDQIKV